MARSGGSSSLTSGGYTGFSAATGNGETISGGYGGDTLWNPETLAQATDLDSVNFNMPEEDESTPGEIEEIAGTSTQKQLYIVGKTLVDVKTNGTLLTISYYPNSQVGAKNSTTGLYAITTSVSLDYRTIELNPDDTVRYKIYRGGQLVGDWTLGGGTGSQVVELDNLTHKKTIEDETIDSGGDRVETRETRFVNGATDILLSKKVSTYREYSIIKDSVPGVVERLKSVVQDPDGAALVTEYDYAGDDAHIWWIKYPDGNWEWHDGTTTWKPFLDTPFPDPETGPAAALEGYVIETKSIAPLYPEAPDTPSNPKVTFVETWTNGIMTSQTRTHTEDGGSLFGIAGLKVTRSRVMTSIEPEPETALETATYRYPQEEPGVEPGPMVEDQWVNSQRTYAVVHPDQSCEVYSYAKGDYSPTGGFTESASGTALRTQVSRGYNNADTFVLVAGKSTMTETVENADKKTMQTREYVYTSPTATTALSTARYEYDAKGNLLNIKRNAVGDGSNWVTTYSATYDAVTGDQLTSTDEFGVVSTSSTSALTYTSSSSDGVVTKTMISVSDAAGRMLSEGDGIYTTTYAYSTSAGGGRKVTATRPNGGTSITEYYRDGRLKSISGTGAIPWNYDYDTSTGQLRTKKTSPDGNRKKWTSEDMAGRTSLVYRSAFAGGSLSETYHYNDLGQLVSITTTGTNGVPGTPALVFAPKMFTYDALGAAQTSGFELDGGSTLDASGSSADRVNYTDQSYALISLPGGSMWMSVSKSGVYLQNGTLQILKEIRTLPNGMLMISVGPGTRTITETTTVDRDNQKKTVETVDSDIGAAGVAVYQGGRTLISQQEPWQVLQSTPLNTIQTSYTYLGPGGRLSKVTDAGGNETSFTYWGQGSSGAGLVRFRNLPDGSSITESYNKLDLNVITTGATYYMERDYNSFGELLTMKTVGQAGQGTTTWNHDSYTGLVSSKVDSLSKSTSYEYDAAGRVTKRTNARGIVTSYEYTSVGELNKIDYGDSTPDATGMSYDKAGRLTAVADASGARAMTYSNLGYRQNEVYTGGILGGYSVNRSYTNQRISSLSASGPGSFGYNWNPVYSSTDRSWRYTTSRFTQRLKQIPKPGMLQIETVDKNIYVQPLDSMTGYDALGRIIRTKDVVGTTVLNAYGTDAQAIQYDSRGRRTDIPLEDGSKWHYEYNNKGELLSGSKKFADGATFVPGAQFSYTYDSIGNRLTSAQGGKADGTGLSGRSYTSNKVNAYTAMTNPTEQWITGSAASTAKIFVNGLWAWRYGSFFGAQASLGNGSGASTPTITLKAEMTPSSGSMVSKTQTGTLWVPPASVSPTYDDDGNLTSDGLWNYTWDGENRLIAKETVSTLSAASQRRTTYDYDFEGRLIRLTNYTKPSGSWVADAAGATMLIYNGWNIIAERQGTSTKRTYTWGIDMSGTFEGAAGIGGLLSMFEASSNKDYLYTYDANGNVTGLIDSADGTVAAKYEYGPFGELLRASGPMAKTNPFRWSTKYTENESGLVYYGHRFYKPDAGRWLNRDPREEGGGINLYSFVANNGIDRIDIDGRGPFKDYWLLLLVDTPRFVVDWAAELGDDDRDYTEKSSGADKRLWDSLKKSQGYKQLLEEYQKNACDDSKPMGYGHLESYAENFNVSNGFNPANFQVGGFSAKSRKLPEKAEKLGYTKVEFTIENTASIGSLTGLNTVADLVGHPEWKGPNPRDNPGPGGDIRQKFIYVEEICCPQ